MLAYFWSSLFKSRNKIFEGKYKYYFYSTVNIFFLIVEGNLSQMNF